MIEWNGFGLFRKLNVYRKNKLGVFLRKTGSLKKKKRDLICCFFVNFRY